MLFELLSDLVKIENILFIVRNSGVVSEIRNNSFSIKQKEKWITIGDNDDPAHMHIDSELITSAEFVKTFKYCSCCFWTKLLEVDPPGAIC